MAERDVCAIDGVVQSAPDKKRRHLHGGMRHDRGWAPVSAPKIVDDDTGQATRSGSVPAISQCKHAEVLDYIGIN